MLRRGFHTLIRCFVLLPNRCGISQSTPLWGPAFSLALVPFSNQCWTPTKSTSLRGQHPCWHMLMSTPLWGSASSLAYRPVSSFDIICNGPSPTLVDIVLFGLSRKVFLFLFYLFRHSSNQGSHPTSTIQKELVSEFHKLNSCVSKP